MTKSPDMQITLTVQEWVLARLRRLFTSTAWMYPDLRERTEPFRGGSCETSSPESF